VARKDLPASDLKGLVAWLKANPDKATEGTAGPGSGQHVSGIYFQDVTKTRFQFVPYRAAPPRSCATSWPDTSISHSIKPLRLCRMCATAE
ncbi:MAG TPA: tripartite tricarboxylate transporter substrate-binding protein, partial [Bradyrhizobium sp.]|nr:tripartite tricarboxylate transporter substrate-binding protein [Bradyrhizobium sp.]